MLAGNAVVSVRLVEAENLDLCLFQKIYQPRRVSLELAMLMLVILMLMLCNMDTDTLMLNYLSELRMSYILVLCVYTPEACS